MSGVMNLLPGVGKIKQQMANANIDETVIKRQEAIIGSMTREERKNPKVIHASRKKRIAAGSGTSVQDVNKLLKQHLQMSDMMKRMRSEEHTSELQSLMRISYADFCLKKKNNKQQ